MGCSALSSLSAVPPAAQNGDYGSGGSIFGNDPIFESSAFDFQSQENREAKQNGQNTSQRAYDYDYAFASTDPQATDAKLSSSLFENAWFTDSTPANSSSGNYAYDSDYQYASSGF